MLQTDEDLAGHVSDERRRRRLAGMDAGLKHNGLASLRGYLSMILGPFVSVILVPASFGPAAGASRVPRG